MKINKPELHTNKIEYSKRYSKKIKTFKKSAERPPGVFRWVLVNDIGILLQRAGEKRETETEKEIARKTEDTSHQYQEWKQWHLYRFYSY